MVGSMGCASSFGLGLAWARPNRRVVVLDGDGALLMRLGALATLGYERPTNLVHVLLDNEAHESTGGQSTVSHSVDLAGVARACGYPTVAKVGDAADLEKAVRDRRPGLRFIPLKTRHGVPGRSPAPEGHAARGRRAHSQGARRRHGHHGLRVVSVFGSISDAAPHLELSAPPPAPRFVVPSLTWT